MFKRKQKQTQFSFYYLFWAVAPPAVGTKIENGKLHTYFNFSCPDISINLRGNAHFNIFYLPDRVESFRNVYVSCSRIEVGRIFYPFLRGSIIHRGISKGFDIKQYFDLTDFPIHSTVKRVKIPTFLINERCGKCSFISSTFYGYPEA